MKKLVSLLAIVALSTTLLAGCNKATESTTSEATTDTAVESVQADPVDQKTVFVSPQWVKSVIDGNQPESSNYVILDAAWGDEADSTYTSVGHIPGSVHVDIASVEGEPMWNLLPADEVEKNMLAHGVTKDTVVILTGDDPSGTARVAYAYLWAGVENVKVLDGGRAAWTNAGYEFEKTSNKATPATSFGATVPVHPEYQLSIDTVKEKLEKEADTFQLVSIRSWAEHIGETSGYSYMDKAGEPKGAVWGKGGSDPYHMEDYVHADGTYITMDEMKTMLEELNLSFDKEMSFYCGTGWRASIPFLLMCQSGYTNMSMYDGGWYEWIADPSNPVQVGDPNSNDVVFTTVGELPDDKAVK